MRAPILHRSGAEGDQALIGPPDAPLTLARARLHEFCGPGRRALAAMLMGRMAGPVVWAYPAWDADRLHPPGLAAFVDPHRLILCGARRPEDIPWVLEESLRSGAVPLCVAEWAGLPGLTAVRRLHLAAEAGAVPARAAGRPAPLGVILTEGEGGAAGVETRWHMAAIPPDGPPAPWGGEAAPHWRLRRLRARSLPPAAWTVAGIPPALR